MARQMIRWLTLAAGLGLTALRPAGAADLVTPAPAPLAPLVVSPDYGRFTIIEENDFLQPYAGTDRHYTQGALFSYLSPRLDDSAFAERFYSDISSVLPILQPGPGVTRKFDVVLGQSLFNPITYRTFPLSPKDRPFAAWLYTGGSLLQETNGNMLENFEFLGGVVGPAALGEQVQTGFHNLIGFDNKQLSQTWKTQLKNEPGIALTYERKWKVWQSSLFGFETDAIPEAGLTAGNVLTYAEAGGMVRIGQNLGVDYGVARVRPSLSGTAWFDANRLTSPWGWYLFAGIQARAVARNIFLDGNTFATSRSVEKEIFVGDGSVGGSIFYKDLLKLDGTWTVRSNEFTLQRGPDHYGTIDISFRF